MPTITTKDHSKIYSKDWGTGQPVVFSHGWPLSADAWEDQMVSWPLMVIVPLRMTAVVTAGRASHGMATI